MSTRELIFDGKEKNIYSTENPDIVLIHYNDVTTAYGGIKRAVIKDKGICNNHISALAFQLLAKEGVENHFISLENDREQLCRRIEIIPLQVVVRNRLAGSTARLLGVANGTVIPNTVFELRYNNDRLKDPMINDTHVIALGIVSKEELDRIYSLTARANEVLKEFFHKAGMELIDIKLECGRTSDGKIILSDEISPDNCRIWDEKTGEVLDKDRFRHDMSDVTVSYQKVMERLEKAYEV